MQNRRGESGPELRLSILESEYVVNQKCLGGQTLVGSQTEMTFENGHQLLKAIVFITKGLQFGFAVLPSLGDWHVTNLRLVEMKMAVRTENAGGRGIRRKPRLRISIR